MNTNPKKAAKLEKDDLTLVQKCFYKKENAQLKKGQLESNIRIAQLEAQNALQSVQKDFDSATKEYESALEAICAKYGIDLSVDKINLVEGVITRESPPAVEEDDDSETEDDDEDEE